MGKTYKVNMKQENSTVQSVSTSSTKGLDTETKIEDIDINEDNLPCRWGPLKCCQIFRNPKLVLFLLCCASCIQGMVVNGFISVIISSIERRFDLKSTDSGLIASSYDIAVLLSLVPVTYFGGLGSKPWWLGSGIILMGLGSFVFAIPHFTTGLYEYNISSNNDGGFCDASRNLTSLSACSSTTSTSLYNYKYVLILGQLMHGVGAAPLFSLGVTYLDENLTQKMSSIYISIFYGMAIAGPALGFLLGGYFLRFYTDFDKVSSDLISITESSVSWVGAWWPGFLFGGVFAIITGVLLLGFPKYLPNTAKIRAEKVSEAYGGAKAINTRQTGISSVKDMPKYIKLILSNPTIIFLSLAGASEAIMTGGVTTFIPKYMQSQFGVSPSMAALIVGAVTVPAGGGGTFIGGYLVKRFNLTLPACIKFCIVGSIIVVIGVLSFLIKCEDINFAGINAAYNNFGIIPSENELSSSCNQDCSCPFAYYNPVCGMDNAMYFSSCAAGCTNVTVADGTRTYHNCSCIAATTTNDMNTLNTATGGTCKTSCNLMPLYVCIFLVTVFTTFLIAMPALYASLRSVPDKQRSFALGIQWIIIRSLGSIPGPITYGAVVDLTCLFWLNPCGNPKDGACYFYDNTKLSYYMLALTGGCKVASILFFTLAWLLYKAPPPPSSENGDIQNDSSPGNSDEWKYESENYENQAFDSSQNADAITQ